MRRRFFFSILAIGLASTLVAFQWTNRKKDKPRDPTKRNLEGLVTLPDGNPANGAVVKLKNLKTLQVTSYITQNEGKYKFFNLSTNVDYQIKADFKDLSSSTRTLSVFDSRLDAVINLQLEEAEKKQDNKSD
jgi:hypothetical protein